MCGQHDRQVRGLRFGGGFGLTAGARSSAGPLLGLAVPRAAVRAASASPSFDAEIPTRPACFVRHVGASIRARDARVIRPHRIRSSLSRPRRAASCRRSCRGLRDQQAGLARGFRDATARRCGNSASSISMPTSGDLERASPPRQPNAAASEQVRNQVACRRPRLECGVSHLKGALARGDRQSRHCTGWSLIPIAPQPQTPGITGQCLIWAQLSRPADDRFRS